MLAEIEPYFARDFQSARRNFRAAARSDGHAVETIDHPLTGPDGAPLATDTVRIGPEDAAHLLVLTSGMHGPELYCGSGCQSALLGLGLLKDLPADTAVLLVHAINPWGSAHARRVTENNVDPCRNFLDFASPLPENQNYARLHPWLGLEGRRGAAGDQARGALAALRDELGAGPFDRAMLSGQHSHADGFSYGGTAPEWTNRTISALLEQHGAKAKKVAAVDFHSGVGPWGYGLAVVAHSDPAALARARRWYGAWVITPNAPTAGDQAFYPVTGHSCDGYAAALPGVEVTAMVLEFGSYPQDRFVRAMSADHWLQFRGADADPAECRAIKAELAELFNPDDAEWRAAVWDRSRQAIRQAFAGLAE